MTRQRLRESSVKWNMVLSLDSFALKVVKKSEELAFFNKAKIINLIIPEKVKNYIEKNLGKEIIHFKKKYKLEFNLSSDKNLIVPEYKIDLLNKNKKIIKKIENIQEIEKDSKKYNYKSKEFKKKKYGNKFNEGKKFRKKFHYRSRYKKNTFDNKKIANY